MWAEGMLDGHCFNPVIHSRGGPVRADCIDLSAAQACIMNCFLHWTEAALASGCPSVIR